MTRSGSVNSEDIWIFAPIQQGTEKTEKSHVFLWINFILNWKQKVCLQQPAMFCLSNSNVGNFLPSSIKIINSNNYPQLLIGTWKFISRRPKFASEPKWTWSNCPCWYGWITLGSDFTKVKLITCFHEIFFVLFFYKVCRSFPKGKITFLWNHLPPPTNPYVLIRNIKY